MTEYEVLIESINPCGGEQYAQREILEIETADPVAYAAENSPYPVLKQERNSGGDLVITTGNGAGYIKRYTFTE